MKKQQKKPHQVHSFFYVLVLVATLGALQAILSPKISETYVESEIEAPVSSSEASTSSPGVLSNGDRVIYTKTAYFDNEVQVWLASEQDCNSVGLGTSCINDLMGMAYTESRSFNYRAMGDGNKSFGGWQIHLGYHPEVTIEQATDPYWAAKWTINRLIAKGYLRDRDYAIMSHNGTPGIPTTIAYLATVNKYINL